jgi:hypothetical protein
MTDARLTDELALRVMGWRPTRDRFIKPGGGWSPRWRFRPFDDVADAFALLDRATDNFNLIKERDVFTAEVHIGGRLGRAAGEHEARTITTAIARALGVEA